jgi:hypothetical protein
VRFLRRKTKDAFKEHPYLKLLHKHLLRIGGLEVVLWNGTNGETVTQMLIQSVKPDQEAKQSSNSATHPNVMRTRNVFTNKIPRGTK